MDKTAAGIRTFVTDLLKKNKALTEREVKAAIGKAFKLNPKTISAGVIRDVRKRLGIDRPGAIAYREGDAEEEPGARGQEGHRRGRLEVRHPARTARRLAPSTRRLESAQRAVRAARAAQARRRIRQARPAGPSAEGLAFRGRDLGDVSGQRQARGSRGVLPRLSRASSGSARGLTARGADPHNPRPCVPWGVVQR